MSMQIEFLKSVIANAKAGNEEAILLLRQICKEAAEKAPLHSLLSMGQYLIALNEEEVLRS